MSTNNIFPSMSADLTPEQLCGDIDGNVIASADWYTPVSYTYEQPYLTPLPSSTVEPQQWQYARASIPDLNMTTYPMAQNFNAFQPALQAAPGRPRSSPSTFGPSPEHISWAPSAGLGIQYTTGAPQPTPMTSTFPPTAFQTCATDDLFETPSPPQLQQPQPRRPYQPIAPNPASVPAPKRAREEDDPSVNAGDLPDTPNGRKRRRTNSATTQTLTKDEAYLVYLKETEGLPWKDIVARYKSDKGEVVTEAALQMRHTRMRQKARAWEEQDLRALELACKHWEKQKWIAISDQMLEYNIKEKWPPRAIERKCREMNLLASTAPAPSGPSSLPTFSSPPGSSMAYSWVPLRGDENHEGLLL